MKRINCYTYTRVSTAMQVDGYSLDAQREKLRRYAEFQNMQIAGEYTDEGKSGKNIEGRPEFCRMLEDIATGKDNVEYVLVFKLSRFGRNAADVRNSLQQMQDYGVNLICVEDGIDSSRDSGKLMISVLSAVAEIERENILVQTMEGRKQKAREGKWNGGFAPYGYKLENGELIIVEEEAVVIREIYDQYIHTTLGANEIAKHLNQKGFQKIQRQNGTLDTFSAHFVKLVLDNPVYAGKLAYGRRKNEKIQGSRNEYHVVQQNDYPVYDGIHEATIPCEDWLAAQKKRKETGRKNEKVYSLDHQHILSGIVCCPGCGQPMYGSVNRKRKKDGSFYRDYWYYACKHRLELDGHPCDYKHQIHQKELNAAVEEVVLKIVQNPDFAEAMRRRLDSVLETEALETEVTAAQKQARQLRASKDRTAERMDHLDSADPHYDQKYEDLETRLDKLYDEIAQAEAREAAAREKWEQIRQQKLSGEKFYDFLTLYGIIYQEMTDAQKREFMHCFIKRVEVYPEKQPDGRILKSIKFDFPVWFGADICASGLPAEKVTPETVVRLSRRDRNAIYPDGMRYACGAIYSFGMRYAPCGRVERRPPMTLYDRLLPLRDEDYRAFQVKLVPNIPAETVIGVRTPALRQLAKTLSPAEAEAFLHSLPHKYYEENLVHFFLLSRIRDFDTCARAVDTFLPYVDCWPVSDQATPAAFHKNHDRLLPYIRKWLASSHVYTARFAIRMLMNEYLDGDFTPEYPTLAAAKIGEEYYLNMMVAWYFATALAKRYDDVLPYLERRALGEWVHKKTIQKAVESYRVSDEHKAYLKTLR